MTFRRGLLIGRFQPLHFGHIHLFHEALKKIETLTVGVGSSQDYQVHIDENPFPFSLRKQMLESMIEHEHLAARIDKILPLTDDPDDDTWRVAVLKQTGPIDVVVSNNDWVNGIFTRVGIPSLSVPLYRRDLYEGKKIREILKDSQQYHDYLPEYVWQLIK
ncbi:adenylyltransferase/cytidyltransferase family protein [Candidatus Microgenomates bacterium]|nr:adenylyltransferase/cytidyltransferase family protein [Candidatus Microgenomates bacterium]